MSLPREWSFQDACRASRLLEDTDLGVVATAASSQEMVITGSSAIIDENMNNQPATQLGSLFSIHSAPVFDLSGSVAVGAPSPNQPGSLAVQVTATSTPIVPPHLQSPEGTLLEDEDNDNLLTISSLTARPLIAKSRELRSVSERIFSVLREPDIGKMKDADLIIKELIKILIISKAHILRTSISTSVDRSPLS